MQMFNLCDQNDKENLMAHVNMLTSEKMSVAQAVADERMAEVNTLRADMLKDVGF